MICIFMKLVIHDQLYFVFINTREDFAKAARINVKMDFSNIFVTNFYEIDDQCYVAFIYFVCKFCKNCPSLREILIQ